MKRVEVRLNLEAVAPLLDVIKTAADELRPRLAIAPTIPDHEAVFAAVWRGELLAAQNADIGTLLALFGSEFFALGSIALEPDNCEAVLRACAALRLHLRARVLAALGDDALESGEVALDTLPEEQRRAFAAFSFLATLQELTVQHLDPTAGE
jgi:hypothetical protein